MAEGVLFNVAEGIIGRLQSLAAQEIGLVCGVKDELEKLEKTVTKIKGVLLDAEDKQVNHEVKKWLKSLEDVIYDADDLVDEFYTESRWRQEVTANKISKKVRLFFSSSNQLVFRLKIGHKIKDINMTLDSIANDRRFHLDERVGESRVITKDRQSHSFARMEEIVGRDKDKNAVIELLVNPRPEEIVSIVSIVGIGGMGKTALAQLIFNDKMVQKHFELKIWICVSDTFDLTSLIKKIIESATSQSLGNLEMDQLQNCLRKEIDQKRYLLVLDDVWNENREKWLSLKTLLMGGARGSRILITTRSEVVAKISDTTKPYILGGLDENQSWSLFKQMAFINGKEPENLRIKEIGVEIVRKCKGVPLAIRTIGRMLYAKHQETEWLDFKKNDLSKIPQEATDILPTLKLSYDILPSHLKHCFAYCSLFPKDYEINIKTLVNLWVAQGFVESLDEGKSMEDIGYEYCMEFLWRSFFQEEKYDEWGEVISSCKMHDLMHDLASSVSRDCMIIDPSMQKFPEKLRHVSFDLEVESGWEIPPDLFKADKIRTFLFLINPTLLLQHWFLSNEMESSKLCNAIASNFHALRMLSLNGLGLITLPSCLCKMIHLRYLDLSYNPIERLPKFIVRLQNLQTLDLTYCDRLRELPRDIKKLFNLRHLHLSGCDRLTHMPRGMGELKSLRTLDRFVLGKDSGTCGGLGELNSLNELMGELSIENLKHGKDAISVRLSDKPHLRSLTLDWIENTSIEDGNVVENGEMLLEALQPHRNLKELSVVRYGGARISNWLSSLTNIVNLRLYNCQRCQYLPPFEHLPYLQDLTLHNFSALENISDREYCADEMSASPIPFFPSLKEITLGDCPNLKGWWKPSAQIGPSMTESEYENQNQPHLSLPFFPCLSKLYIYICPNLTSMPLYPHLESLSLSNTSLKSLEQTMMMTATVMKNEDILATTTSTSTSTCSPLLFLLSCFACGASDQHVNASSSSPLSKLLDLSIWRIDDLECIPEIWLRNLTSLKHLTLRNCCELRCIPLSPSPFIQHLTTLESLEIGECNELNLWKDGNYMHWKALSSLTTLGIYSCDHLTALPEGLCNLTSLRSLYIVSCSNLASLPEWMRCLTSLERLEIVHCSDLLLQRCKKETGDDWSKIAHIPDIRITI